jgi:hypothetical protein
MCAGHTVPHWAFVDQVVMDNGSGMHQLHRGGGLDERITVRLPACSPPPVAESRSQPLSPGHRCGQLLSHREQIRIDSAEQLRLTLRELM